MCLCPTILGAQPSFVSTLKLARFEKDLRQTGRKHARAKDGQNGADVVKFLQPSQPLLKWGSIEALHARHGPYRVDGKHGPDDAEHDEGGPPAGELGGDAAQDDAEDEA